MTKVPTDPTTLRLRAARPHALTLACGAAVGLWVGAAQGQDNWPVYLVVTVLGGIAAAILHARYGFSQVTLVGLVVFALGHVAGGMFTVGDQTLYGLWLIEPVVRFDNVQHAVGFGVVGRAAWELLRHRVPLDRLVTVVLITAFAVAAGAMNEIIEWVMTLTIHGTDVGGYDNTARDLVANLVGGLAAATLTAGHR